MSPFFILWRDLIYNEVGDADGALRGRGEGEVILLLWLVKYWYGIIV